MIIILSRLLIILGENLAMEKAKYLKSIKNKLYSNLTFCLSNFLTFSLSNNTSPTPINERIIYETK